MVERLADATSQLLSKLNAVETATDIGVCNIGSRVASLFSKNGLLFEQCNQQFVGVLGIFERQDVSGIHLVQH